MPAYVITPSGELLIYQRASHAIRNSNSNGKTELYVDQTKGDWVADIPGDWAVGWHRPAYSSSSDALSGIKRALRNFDARTGRFKD